MGFCFWFFHDLKPRFPSRIGFEVKIRPNLQSLSDLHIICLVRTLPSVLRFHATKWRLSILENVHRVVSLEINGKTPGKMVINEVFMTTESSGFMLKVSVET